MPQLHIIPVQWRIYWQDMSVVIPYALAWCYWMTLSLPPGAPQDCLKIKTSRPVGPRTNLFCYALKPCYLPLYNVGLTAYTIKYAHVLLCFVFVIKFSALNKCLWYFHPYSSVFWFLSYIWTCKNLLCGTYLFKGINNDVFCICCVYGCKNLSYVKYFVCHRKPCRDFYHFSSRYSFFLLQVSVSHPLALLWRHNGHDGVSNHQPHDSLLNRLFRRRSKKTSKLCVTGLCAPLIQIMARRRIGEIPLTEQMVA